MSFIPGVDTLRHASVFDPVNFTSPIHVVGAGAVGSHVLYMLAKLGIKGSLITAHDFDTVGSHNVANQYFSNSDIGKLKTTAIRDRLLAETGCLINTNDAPVTPETRSLAGYVFLAVDSMKARKDIVSLYPLKAPLVEWFFEARLGVHNYSVFSFTPEDTKKWLTEWYPDNEVAPANAGACQTQQMLCPTACASAAALVSAFLEAKSSLTTAFRRFHDMRMNYSETTK